MKWFCIIKTGAKQLKKKKEEEETGGSGKRATDREHVTQGEQSAVAIKCSLNLYTYVRLSVRGGEKKLPKCGLYVIILPFSHRV